MPIDPAPAPLFTTLLRALRRDLRDLFADCFPGVVVASAGDRRGPTRRRQAKVPVKLKILRKVLAQYAVVLVIVAGLGYGTAATYVLTDAEYRQTFDSVGTALPEGFAVWTGASDTGLGNGAILNLNATAWNSSTGQFANYASLDGLTSAATTAAQAASTDRVIGLRQTGNFGDPGAAITFNFDATAANFSGTGVALSLSLQMLSVQTRSTTLSIQYGIGPSPSSFTTLGTYTDPGVFGATIVTFTGNDLAALSGLSNVYLRIVALGLSSGGGSRDTFGLDDFNLFYTPIVPPPPSGYFWIGNDTTLGGSGTWDQNTTLSWSADSTTIVPRVWNNVNQTANFGGTGGTVTVSGTVIAGAGLSFTADAYNLAGGTIQLLGATPAANLVAVSTGTTTISTALTGTSGLSKSGAGALILTGDNSGLTGGITLSGGTLAIGSATSLGTPGTNALTFNGGTLTSSNATAYTLANPVTFAGDAGFGAASTGNLELSGPIAFGTGTRTLSVGAGVTLRISGTTSDGGFIKAGLGALQFPVSNDVTTFGISGGTALIPVGTTLTTTALPLSSVGGVLTIEGTLRSTAIGVAAAWSAPLGMVTVAATGTVIQQGGASATNFIFSSNTTWTPGSTFIFRDFTTTPAVSGRNYTMNVIFDSSTGDDVFVGAISGGSPLTFSRDFTLGEHTFITYGSGFTSTTNFVGNITVNGTLGVDGGARGFTVNTGKVLSIGANGEVDIQGGEKLTINGLATVNGIIAGNGEVVISGGGTAVVSGSIVAATGTTVGNTGTLRGATTVTLLTVASGGTVSPGANPGILAVEESSIFQSGGRYLFELDTDGSSGAAGTNWDRVAVSGTLNLIGLSSDSPFVLKLQTLTPSDVNGSLASWNGNVNHTWAGIVTTTGGFVSGTFASNLFTVDTSSFANAFGGTFSVTANGNNLDLTYLAVPEPSATLSLLGGMGMIASLRRRNRRAEGCGCRHAGDRAI